MPKKKHKKKPRYSGPNRRKFLRLATVFAIEYLRISKNLKRLTNIIKKGRVKDISAGGIKFATHEEIPPGTFVELKFTLPGIAKTISGIGKIVRVKTNPENKSHDMGLAFVWLHQKHADLIDSYVRKAKLLKILRKLKKM